MSSLSFYVSHCCNLFLWKFQVSYQIPKFFGYTHSNFSRGLKSAALVWFLRKNFDRRYSLLLSTDFAVGAPYEGTIGGCMKSSVTGAVYIYHGSKSGARRQPSQKISAEQISQRSQSALTTFGFSLSGGIDMDNNQYPDLAVGAYESDIVYLFR